MLLNDPKIHALLIDEEMARVELSKNINSLLNLINSGKSYEGEEEEVLLSFKEYMAGIKELTDLLKKPTQHCIAPEEK